MALPYNLPEYYFFADHEVFKVSRFNEIAIKISPHGAYLREEGIVLREDGVGQFVEEMSKIHYLMKLQPDYEALTTA